MTTTIMDLTNGVGGRSAEVGRDILGSRYQEYTLYQMDIDIRPWRQNVFMFTFWFSECCLSRLEFKASKVSRLSCIYILRQTHSWSVFTVRNCFSEIQTIPASGDNQCAAFTAI